MNRTFLKKTKPALITLVIGLSVFFGYLAIQTPAIDGDWSIAHAVAARAEVTDTQINLHHIRNFSYRADGSIETVDYLTQQYNLDELEQVWLGLANFGPFGLAHSFLSFEFSNKKFLVISIEARLEKSQHYSPLKGMFRQFNKIYIASTEKDVIGLRSHIRKEKVFLYPLISLQGNQNEEAKKFFLQIIEDMNNSYQHAEFYNTIVDNCLTNIIKHGDLDALGVSRFDTRVLLPGRIDNLTYTLGITPNSKSFVEERQQALINPEGFAIDDPLFSLKIRKQEINNEASH